MACPATAATADAWRRWHPGPPSRGHCARESGATGRDVVELVKRGNLQAIQAVRQAGRDIGEVLTAAVSLINPSVIAIGGSMARAGEHLIAGVREVVYTRSMPLATEHLSIGLSMAGDQAAILGASQMVTQYVLSPAVIEATLQAAG